ncbi:MAG TPA: S8 family serine peptidase [Puia sp.]|nr:S8 family serine peptidase [Puia sp.]
MRNLLPVFWVAIVTSSCSQPSSSGRKPGEADTLQGRMADALPNWQNQDLQSDGVFGISTENAYDRLLKNKKATTVIVAVIDSGIDTAHEDLSSVLWTDPVDGSHGRNYILKEAGKEDFIPMLANKTNAPGYRKILEDYNFHVQRLEIFMNQLKESKKILEQIVQNIGKENPSPEDLKLYRCRNEDEKRILDLVLDRLPWYPDFARLQFCEADHLLDLGQYHLEHGLNRIMTVQDTVQSAYAGGVNADISYDALGFTSDPNAGSEHGTHMSGIIAAVRNNGKGINGIADHVRIMMLKVSGNIREMRNEYLAPAIRFAVDHGARVISMSFGKTFSLHRDAVDKAVQYAMSRDVLLVHSAGNDGMDLDVDSNSFFPSAVYLDGGVAPAWITVGASGYRDDSTLAASFSNYGRRTVDVFAPGVQINSTIPHSRYVSWDGTSEAAPVVAGLAALIRSYYPLLSAVQVKEIIMKTVVRREVLKNKCISGGVVNAYQALQLAAGYK